MPYDSVRTMSNYSIFEVTHYSYYVLWWYKFSERIGPLDTLNLEDLG